MKVIVTGAGGFIGTQLVRELCQRGTLALQPTGEVVISSIVAVLDDYYQLVKLLEFEWNKFIKHKSWNEGSRCKLFVRRLFERFILLVRVVRSLSSRKFYPAG